MLDYNGLLVSYSPNEILLLLDNTILWFVWTTIITLKIVPKFVIGILFHACFHWQTGCCIWEQEIYNQFKYKTPRPFFHTFDTDVSERHIYPNLVMGKVLETFAVPNVTCRFDNQTILIIETNRWECHVCSGLSGAQGPRPQAPQNASWDPWTLPR